MPSASITFPLEETQTAFGRLVIPRIAVEVRTIYGYQAYRFLLDTGADFTMLPRFMAADLGIDISRCRRLRSIGIEGKAITSYLSTMHIRLTSWEFDLACLISKKDTTPFILGRMGVFNRFTIFFDNRRKRIVLTKI